MSDEPEEYPEVPFESLVSGPSRICKEPIRIGALLARGGLFPKGAEDPATAVHPFAGLCKWCDKELPDVPWRQIQGCEGWYPINTCDHCYETRYGPNAQSEERRREWELHCPPDYRQPWDARKRSDGLLKRVLQFNPKAGKGMMIHGLSGSCKTRAAWALNKKLSEEGFQVVFIASIDLPDENVKDMIHAQVLIIDDLGNDKMQSNKEATVLKIIRHRCDWHRPTIVTSQFTGDKLQERFSDGNTAKAVIRRLREYCEDVPA